MALQLSKQRKNKILGMVLAYERGELTVYQVAKGANVTWHTANKWLKIYGREIKKNEAKIIENITNPVQIEQTGRKITLWQKIKNRIFGLILTGPLGTPSPK